MRRTSFLAICALALVLAGCGGGGNGSADKRAAADPELRDLASQKVEEAATKVVNATHDKNLTGPKFYKPVCLEPGSKYAVNVPANAIKCHIEAFSAATATKPQGYIGSEDWIVTVNKDRSFGQPEIAGEYRIKAYLEADNKYNCSGHKAPPTKCTPPPPPPPEAAAQP
jgi:hypothetical protein